MLRLGLTGAWDWTARAAPSVLFLFFSSGAETSDLEFPECSPQALTWEPPRSCENAHSQAPTQTPWPGLGLGLWIFKTVSWFWGGTPKSAPPPYRLHHVLAPEPFPSISAAPILGSSPTCLSPACLPTFHATIVSYIGEFWNQITLCLAYSKVFSISELHLFEGIGAFNHLWQVTEFEEEGIASGCSTVKEAIL